MFVVEDWAAAAALCKDSTDLLQPGLARVYTRPFFVPGPVAVLCNDEHTINRELWGEVQGSVCRRPSAWLLKGVRSASNCISTMVTFAVVFVVAAVP